MSWGERSCLRPCRMPDYCDIGTCNCECPGYIWDGKTDPDSIMRSDYPLESHFKKLKTIGSQRKSRRRKKYCK